jgi:hypothetical protein
MDVERPAAADTRGRYCAKNLSLICLTALELRVLDDGK